MKKNELVDFINNFSKINEVEAVVLGGSRATNFTDNKADYDIYVYSENGINKEIRQKIISKYCDYYEIDNTYWEQEDNGIFKWGINVDIIYRNLSEFINKIANVVEKYESYNGFTTCFWHNILNSEIYFDKNDIFAKAKNRFQVPYPKKLKENIVKRNMTLLTGSIISYDTQITKSVYRKDHVNINNRLSAFFASYFDIIFAINELPHPGEKRIIEICLNKCNILPNDFEQNVNELLKNMKNETTIIETVHKVILELKEVIKTLE